MASFGNAGDSSQSENQDDLDSSAPATRLVENSALREAENEVISIITKLQRGEDENGGGKSHSNAASFNRECAVARANLLNICHQSRFCHESHVRPTISEMCTNTHINDRLEEMSLHAAEQMICIIGVCIMCSGLYFMLCMFEKLCSTFFSNSDTNKENET